MAKWEAGVGYGSRAAQPTPTSNEAGKLWYVSDEELLERWSGSAWQIIGGPASGGIVEHAYAEKTTSTTITATSEATGQTIVSATVDVGADEVEIEFGCPNVFTNTTSTGCVIDLWEGATAKGRMALVFGTSTDQRIPVRAYRRYTPGAGSKTFAIKAWKGGGTVTVDAGAGGSGTLMPAFLRIRKSS